MSGGHHIANINYEHNKFGANPKINLSHSARRTANADAELQGNLLELFAVLRKENKTNTT
jgi:hypothetical protein